MYQVEVMSSTYKVATWDEAVQMLSEYRTGEIVDPDGYATTWEELMLDA